MSGAISTAAYVARRAAQKERVQILYRRALKDTLNWAVHRHLFYKDADDLRLRFEANKHVTDLDAVDRMIDEAEATYNKWRHPDPYIGCCPRKMNVGSSNLKLSYTVRNYIPWAPGGSKFCRNPTPPEGVDMIHDFDAEDDHDHHPFPVIQCLVSWHKIVNPLRGKLDPKNLSRATLSVLMLKPGCKRNLFGKLLNKTIRRWLAKSLVRSGFFSLFIAVIAGMAGGFDSLKKV
ncbi:hypothetical protein CUMW_145150 [Citrus unshiu]|nr:hypothetical protein CUMW_145150 [Citrus unshiu]